MEPANFLEGFERPLINEFFDVDRIDPVLWSLLLAEGWRHGSTHFFRHSFDIYPDGDLQEVLPLRSVLNDFTISKSQRKIVGKNRDLDYIIRPAFMDDEKYALFEAHKKRFNFSIPTSIHNFIAESDPHIIPCDGYEISVYKTGRLVACSFFDVAFDAVSGTYAMYDLNESARSLGVFTMILEILYAKKIGKLYYYPGYVYKAPSFYDYKKKFDQLEYFDWEGAWKPFIPNEPDNNA